MWGVPPPGTIQPTTQQNTAPIANQLGKREHTGFVKEESAQLDGAANKRVRKSSDGGKNNDGLSDGEDEEEEEEEEDEDNEDA